MLTLSIFIKSEIKNQAKFILSFPSIGFGLKQNCLYSKVLLTNMANKNEKGQIIVEVI